MPASKSALAQFRKSISYDLVKEQYDTIIQTFMPHMRTYRGYYLVAFDGDQYDLPASEDILDHGYRGFPVDKETETHYPKMYTVKALDLLSGAAIGFKESAKNDEIARALEILPSLPRKTIAIYDRLYLSERLIDGHIENGQDFIARCKSGSTFKEIVSFFESNKRRSFFYYNNKRINLIKVVNPKSGEKIVLATTLDLLFWGNKEMANLYTLRWDVESNNRDSTSTMKIEQWRTKFYNGIMQEIYGHLVIQCMTKIAIYSEGGYQIDLEKNEVNKSNFKLILSAFVDSFSDLAQGFADDIVNKLRFYIVRSKEKRIRLKRSYDREIKKSGKKYRMATKVKRRP